MEAKWKGFSTTELSFRSHTHTTLGADLPDEARHSLLYRIKGLSWIFYSSLQLYPTLNRKPCYSFMHGDVAWKQGNKYIYAIWVIRVCFNSARACVFLVVTHIVSSFLCFKVESCSDVLDGDCGVWNGRKLGYPGSPHPGAPVAKNQHGTNEEVGGEF